MTWEFSELEPDVFGDIDWEGWEERDRAAGALAAQASSQTSSESNGEVTALGRKADDAACAWAHNQQCPA